MKSIKVLFICLLVALASGCFYPDTYFKPKAPSVSDNEQGACLFINRQDLSMTISAYKGSESFIVDLDADKMEVLVKMDVNKVALVNKADGDFFKYIGRRFLKITGGWSGAKEVDVSDVDDTTRMLLQFDPNARNAKELMLSLPLHKYDIETIEFKKTTELGVISIN